MKKEHRVILTVLLLAIASIAFLILKRPLRFDHLTDDTTSDTTVSDVTNTLHPDGREAKLLSAFFGLDNALPNALNQFIHREMGGNDGMPVVFSHELDVDTLQAGDFKVTTESGKLGRMVCVTLAPADDLGEWRTVLLAGEFGNLGNQPVKVEIVGNLLSKNGEVNFRGLSVPVIPLEDGPSMVMAKVIPEVEWEVEKEPTGLPLGGGSGCPPETKQVVRVTWEGGVTKPSGAEIDDVERQLYKVVVLNEDGSTSAVTPFAIADKRDGDNNHRLCLDVEGAPQSVSFPAGHVTDPRRDLNPETFVEVISPEK